MTGVSTFGQAISRINLLNDQSRLLTSLTTQLATGKKTQLFSGLESDVLTSKRARADFQSLETYTSNIQNADRRISLMLSAIEEFQAQAENFASSLVQFSQESVHQKGDVIVYDDPLTTNVIETTQVGMTQGDPDIDLETMQELAANLFDFMGDLLNTQEAERFILGGADSLTQPYTNSGTLDSAISTLINNWKDETLPAATNLTSNELISALRSRTASQDPNAVTDTIIGYSAALSSGNIGDIFVRADENIDIKYTAVANEQPFRDIMVAASFIKNATLGPIADVYAEPYTPGDPVLTDPDTGLPLNGAPGADLDEMKDNFFAVFNDIIGMVNNALDDIDSVRFRLENARVRLDEIQQTHQFDQNTLLNTIDDIENVDINEVAVQINTLQLQLDASYRLTANLQQLSLVNFL